MKLKQFLLSGLACLCATNGPPNCQAEEVVSVQVQALNRTELQAILIEAVSLEKSLVSVHAAELMMQAGLKDQVAPHFIPYREGIASAFQVAAWRVLVRAEEHAADRDEALRKIRRTLMDESSPFRIHAMECLAKLHAPILPDEAETVHQIAFAKLDAAAPFALWRLAETASPTEAFKTLNTLLKSTDQVTCFRAAYALWHLRPLPDFIQQTLLETLDSKDAPALTRLMLALARNDASIWDLAKEADVPSARYFVALELGQRSDDASEQILQELVQDADLDVRAAAACGLLRRLTP